MILLYVFQMIYRSAFYYELFKPALQDSAPEIACESSEDYVPYALYMNNVALVEFDQKGDLEAMTKLTNLQLPLDLALALKHSTKDMEVTYDGVKKNNRRIARLLKDKNMRLLVKDLYEKPILHFKKLG